MRPRRRRTEFEHALRRGALTSKLVAPPHGVEECAVVGRSRGPALQRGDATPETATGIRACSTPWRDDIEASCPAAWSRRVRRRRAEQGPRASARGCDPGDGDRNSSMLYAVAR